MATATAKTNPQPRSFKRVVVRGMAVLLPTVLTLWILWSAGVFVFNNVAKPINGWIRQGITRAMPTVNEHWRPDWYTVTDEELAAFQMARRTQGQPSIGDDTARAIVRRQAFEQLWRDHWYLQVSGLLVAITLLYLAGLLLSGFLGRQIYARVERLISQIPGFKQVYPHVKQLVDLILGDRPMAFSRVVMVQFPRDGAWVIAFVTSSGVRSAEAVVGDCIGVFVPNTPTPFTGFTLIVPADSVVDVNMSVDEALRFVVTGGVLVPPSEKRVEPPTDGAAALPPSAAAQLPESASKDRASA